MKEHYRNEPNSPLMKMVSEFKVAFSVDENQPAKKRLSAYPKER
jgi:hypothetical protein